MSIQLYNSKTSFDSLAPEWAQGKFSANDFKWLGAFLARNLSTYIENVETDFRVLRLDRHVFPLTVNEAQYENSYVCSPYTHNITYAREEVGKLENKPVELFCHALLLCLGVLLKAGKINRAVHVNNWLLSTNLYPDWRGEKLDAITSFLTKKFSKHAIVFRSINLCHEKESYEAFKSQGYHLFLMRRVYIVDGRESTYFKKRDVKQDIKLLVTSDYTVVPHNELLEGDISRMFELYNLLYLEKHSYQNPQFSEAFIRLCLKENLLHITGLRNSEGVLDGVTGSFIRAGVMTTPLVGYDTSLSQSLGLYRMLTAIVLKEAAEKKVLLNLSAGVGAFKRSRGAQGYLEYSALYLEHLPLYRKVPWLVLMFIMNTVGVRIINKYG